MTNESSDVIVVGAGMVGAACTLALAEAGLRVLAIDSGAVGGGTTSKGMGHVCVTPEHPALVSLTAYSRRLWQRIVGGMGEDTDVLACGTMWLAPDDRGAAALEVRRERLRAAEVHAEWIEARVLRRMEPNLGAMVVGALHVPADLAVTPARAARALIDAALSRTSSGGWSGGAGGGGGGARLMSGFEVEAVEPGEVRLAGGLVLRAPAVVVAGGYLSGRLVPGMWIRPRKGHIVAVEAEHSYCFHQLIEVDYLTHAHGSDAESVAFNVQPRPSGVGSGSGGVGGGSGGGGGGGGGGVWIGSSRQYDFSTPEPEPEVIDRMMRRAEEFMPTIRSLRVVQVRVGFRPASRDGLPMIGAVPGMPGVYVATGHEGVGITASTGTARLITDLVLGRASEIDRSAFDPGRFVARPGA